MTLRGTTACRCGICGEWGHNRRTCGASKNAHLAPEGLRGAAAELALRWEPRKAEEETDG